MEPGPAENPATVPSGNQNFPVLSALDFSLGRHPFDAVVQVTNSNLEYCYQALERPDPEGCGLASYRASAVRQINRYLDEGHRIVAVVGPPRSGITEAVLGALYIPDFQAKNAH